MKAGQQRYQRSRCERATYRLYDLRGKQGRAGKSPFPILANSFSVSDLKLGRNATGVSTNIIERLRPSFRIVSGRWSRFSWRSSAPATSDCSTMHCTKCSFRVSNGAINPLPQMFSELEGRCSLLWPPFSNRDTGGPLRQTGVEGQCLTAEDKLLILTQAGLYLTANTLCYLGEFEASRQHAMRGVEIWRSGGVRFPVEEIITPPVSCLIYEAYSEWFLGEIAACRANTAEAISLAKELSDMHALAFALYFAAVTASFERNPAEVERFTSELIELSTRFKFEFWLPGANVMRGWARSISGDAVEGVSWVERGVADYRASGAHAGLLLWLALEAEALYLADRTSEALEAITEAQGLAEKFEVRFWVADFHRLRGP
jgi:hypothetical protein